LLSPDTFAAFTVLSSFPQPPPASSFKQLDYNSIQITVRECINEKHLAYVQNVAACPFLWGMGSELGKKMHATPNAIHRHDTADAVALRVLHDRNFVEEMVQHQVIKPGVPF
jgi:hypothetical protein